MINPGMGSDSKLTVAKIRTVPGIADVGRVDGLQAYFSFSDTLAGRRLPSRPASPPKPVPRTASADL